MSVAHSIADPRREIQDRMAPHMEKIEGLVQVDDVLVALWHGPEKTRGGVIIPDRAKDESIYQGKTGLVVALGKLAFQRDENHDWPDRVPQVGDWVVFRVSDGWPLVVGGREGQHCRLLREGHVRMIVTEPDVVY